MNNTPCIKYDSCSAPICPLDDEWTMRTHIKNEPICPYLHEFNKEGVTFENRGYIAVKPYQAIQRYSQAIKNAHSDIERRLRLSFGTNSRFRLSEG